MCFSVEVQKELKSIAEKFQVEISLEDEASYQSLKNRSQDYDFVKKELNLKRKPTSPFFKEPGADNRVFPGYFSWVIIHENGKNVFKRMRYRLRPSKSQEEIPSKFNVFNARIDSLENRQTWKGLFGRQHGIFPFTRFYEWVEFDGQKRLISFAPKHRELMWAPCLWDKWTNPEGNFGFYSFAIITDDPPAEVSEMGHDRCPIFLEESKIPQWLSPKGLSVSALKNLLQVKEAVFYINEWAAA